MKYERKTVKVNKSNDRLPIVLESVFKLKLKIKQRDICLLTGLDEGLVSNMFSGKRYPSFEAFESLVRISQGKLKMKDWDLEYKK